MANNRGTSSVSPSIVGVFIREKRESLGMSQRALGQLFEPAVTTQFISNIERGVTPLPPVHVATLVRILKLSEYDLLSVMEREYASKIAKRVGRADPFGGQPALASATPVRIAEEDRAFFQAVYDAYRVADGSSKDGFHSLCESLLRVARPNAKAIPK
jgi:transcriptional regulator with XRE-family HTH domain